MSFRRQPTLISMTSIHCPLIGENSPYGSIFELGMQSLKTLAASDSQPLGFPTFFSLASTDGRGFRSAPPIGQAVKLKEVGSGEKNEGSVRVAQVVLGEQQAGPTTLTVNASYWNQAQPEQKCHPSGNR